MRLCHRFSRVYSAVYASRFLFRNVVHPLKNDQVQGEHQDKTTQHDRRVLHNTRTKLPPVECSRHPQVAAFGLVQEPTHLMISTRIWTRERQTATRTRRAPRQTQQIQW